jgi:hypothetical protein
MALIVGIGVCAFSFTGDDSMIRLVFLPLGLFITAASAYRFRRLGRKRVDPDDFE